jgi:hypothetical protein
MIPLHRWICMHGVHMCVYMYMCVCVCVCVCVCSKMSAHVCKSACILVECILNVCLHAFDFDSATHTHTYTHQSHFTHAFSQIGLLMRSFGTIMRFIAIIWHNHALYCDHLAQSCTLLRSFGTIMHFFLPYSRTHCHSRSKAASPSHLLSRRLVCMCDHLAPAQTCVYPDPLRTSPTCMNSELPTAGSSANSRERTPICTCIALGLYSGLL